jgi:hypothetical protein
MTMIIAGLTICVATISISPARMCDRKVCLQRQDGDSDDRKHPVLSHSTPRRPRNQKSIDDDVRHLLDVVEGFDGSVTERAKL